MSIILVFPVHLFKNNELLSNSDSTTKKYIIEDPIYFTKYMTHKLKLILHRASMKKYADVHNLTYIDFDKADSFYKNNKQIIISYDPMDHDVLNKLKTQVRTI